MRFSLFLSLLWAWSAVAATVEPAALRDELEQHRLDVPEFKAIRAEAEKRGLRVFVLGGGAASMAEHAKERLQPNAPITEPRYEWELDHLLYPTQDIDLVVTRADGKRETVKQIEEFRAWVRRTFPRELHGRSLWDVLGLKTAAKGKLALENNPDFLNQHNDSLSLGMVELTEPPHGEGVFRDLGEKSHFIDDIARDHITFLPSPLHEHTARFLEGLNPPILSAVRALEKSLRYGKTMDESGVEELRAIVRDWDPRTVEPGSYVYNYLHGRAGRLLANAKDMEMAQKILSLTGLKDKLLRIPGADVNKVGSMAWLLNREPLPVAPKSAGAPTGRTAGSLGIARVMHWTNEEAFDQITHSYDLRPRLLQSRQNRQGENAVLGDGFYTFADSPTRPRWVSAADQLVTFAVDPAAREGVDFVYDGPRRTVMWKSSRYLTLQPPGPESYHRLLRLSRPQRVRLERGLDELRAASPGKKLSFPQIEAKYPDASAEFWSLAFQFTKPLGSKGEAAAQWVSREIKKVKDDEGVRRTFALLRGLEGTVPKAVEKKVQQAYFDRVEKIGAGIDTLLDLKLLVLADDSSHSLALSRAAYRTAPTAADYLRVHETEEQWGTLTKEYLNQLEEARVETWPHFRALKPTPAEYRDFFLHITNSDVEEKLKLEALATMKDVSSFLDVLAGDIKHNYAAPGAEYLEALEPLFRKSYALFLKLKPPPSFEEKAAFRDLAPTTELFTELSLRLAKEVTGLADANRLIEPRLPPNSPVHFWQAEIDIRRALLPVLSKGSSANWVQFRANQMSPHWAEPEVLVTKRPVPKDALVAAIVRAQAQDVQMPSWNLSAFFMQFGEELKRVPFSAEDIARISTLAGPHSDVTVFRDLISARAPSEASLVLNALERTAPHLPGHLLRVFAAEAYTWIQQKQPIGADLLGTSPLMREQALKTLFLHYLGNDAYKPNPTLKSLYSVLKLFDDAGQAELLDARNMRAIFTTQFRTLITSGQLTRSDKVVLLKALKGSPASAYDALYYLLHFSPKVEDSLHYILAYTEMMGPGKVDQALWGVFSWRNPTPDQLRQAQRIANTDFTKVPGCGSLYMGLGIP